MPFWVNFCVRCETEVQLPSFAHGYPVIPIQLSQLLHLSHLLHFSQLLQSWKVLLVWAQWPNTFSLLSFVLFSGSFLHPHGCFKFIRYQNRFIISVPPPLCVAVCTCTYTHAPLISSPESHLSDARNWMLGFSWLPPPGFTCPHILAPLILPLQDYLLACLLLCISAGLPHFLPKPWPQPVLLCSTLPPPCPCSGTWCGPSDRWLCIWSHPSQDYSRFQRIPCCLRMGFGLC